MKHNISALALCGLLAGCQTTPAPTYQSAAPPTPAKVYAPYTLSAADKNAVEQGVRSSLKDPNSAMFGRMAAAKDSDGAGIVEVCGYVNARNSFGGYTGDALFYGALADTKAGGKAFFPIGSISTSEMDTDVKRTVCAKAGISI